MNGSVFHSMWPVSLLGCGPSSVTPYGVPPSPWGKASSGGGFLPAGRSLTFPWGKVPPQRRMRGGTRSVLRPAPLPSGPSALPPSPRRGYEAPAGRKPSPTGKVDRAQPGTDEGKQPKSEKQATLNGSVPHSMWSVSLLGCGPSSVTPYGVPPSPWGKASSGGGFLPAGASLTFPWGKVPPQRRMRGGARSDPVPPHSRQGLWPCHPLPGEGKGVLHLSQERVGVFSKFSERNPLLLGTLMLEYPRWLWPA